MVAAHGGRGFLWLTVLEIAAFVALFVQLSDVVGWSLELVAAALPCIGLVIWTAALIKPDVRITMNVAQRLGRLVRISPITGARVVTKFSLDDVEGFTLRQIGEWHAAMDNKYVVDLQLRGGARHVLSAHGPLFAYNQVLAQLSGFTGIGNSVERLPAA